MAKALLLSNSILTGSDYLQWCRDRINLFFKDKKNLIFIPYAAVSFPFDEYESKVQTALFNNLDRMKSIHRFKNKKEAIKNCDGILVGGGNTFALKKRLEDEGIFETIKNRIKTDNLPYVGWSAGANLGSPTIKTTNDMPIAQPASFDAFEIVEFQINPHYTDQHPENHNGETRDERLIEFSIFNPDSYCAAIPEGTGILVNDGKTEYFGGKKGKIFHKGKIIKEIEEGEEPGLNEYSPFK